MNWGIQPPAGTAVAFGARAILRDGYVDLIHDRMGFSGEPGEAREALRTFLKTKGDRTIRELATACNPAVAHEFSVVEDGYVVKINTRASHGYLYIGVWPA